MKSTFHHLLATGFLLALPASAETVSPEAKPTPKEVAEGLEKHGSGAKKLAGEQDNLSADVQDLIDEQTNPKMIELLREIEVIMADATDLLTEKNTGGKTIATQTEIIEKIFEAAKKKQQQNQQQQQQQDGQPQQGQGQGGNMQSMLEMMQRMMDGGRDLGEGQQPGQEKGKQAGDKPGQGNGSGGASGGNSGDPDRTAENDTRRVPRSAGTSGTTLPREFQKAMDAYNKGADKKSNNR